MELAEVIAKCKAYKAKLPLDLNVLDVYLFGSYADGRTTEESDIDIAVVIEEMKSDYFDVVPRLWDICPEVDSRIEPILLQTMHDPSGLLAQIKATGIKI